MNQITGMHDGSNVYGSDDEDFDSLREFKGGLLKTYKPEAQSDRTLLPQEEGENKNECEIDETLQDLENRKCFRAGTLSKQHTFPYLKHDITYPIMGYLFECNVSNKCIVCSNSKS